MILIEPTVMDVKDLREKLLSFDYANDIEVRYIPKSKPLLGTVAYMSLEEQRKITQVGNDACVILMTHYYRKASKPKFNYYDDTSIAEELGWTPVKVKKTRLLLIKINCLKRIIFTQTKTRAKVTIFYLGEEMCKRVTSVEEHSRLLAHQTYLTLHFKCTSWEEVVNTYSHEEIVEAMEQL